ncbi:hypothetical protein QYE76_025337 [Lolium multiflorum]|uniref:Uncharacterized protein n=1 Tax=Lolium multiflorum TaxID=4521 RepID=A0AAD8VWL1_LOLMU|nr:hypothetical protein QYE76_025337 [Lolium multiflorum]
MIKRSESSKLGDAPWFTPAYSKKTQASKLGDAQGIPFFIDNIIRNPSKEIFSELDETFAQGPIFARSFQKTEEITKWGHEARRQARPSPGRAACPRAPHVAPALPFRLLKVSVAKPPVPSHDTENLPETPPRIPSRGIQEIASGTLPERDSSPGGLFIAMIASGVMSE